MISILIPTYNCSIKNLVQKLHEQVSRSGIPFEIRVLEDGSSDEYLMENRSIESLSFCNYSLNPTNLGRTQTRHRLAEHAQYDWLLFLDADVMPVADNFIENYIAHKTNNSVFFGGHIYEDKKPNSSQILRYTYGKEREESSISERLKNPYQFVFSGNMMIEKKLFLELNYSENHNFYGMDIYFSYQLFIRKINIIPIDNTVYHLGLENNIVFFEKALDSVVSRKKLLMDYPNIYQINALLSYYIILKKWRLAPIFRIGFDVFEKFLRNKILSNNPKLIYFDLYRLGYICSLK
ncbi:glycosyltransferase family 2 protein [Flavobacterium sp.]|uniref:glycosyltransferase family 2 protein n=1 Tax=Flavobacterium sp. TaxID=239 RepID=UPI002FDA5756